ncbi:5-formyltetrahydrofolate cyclo-ligase [Caldicellulosiruptor hydrothermalis 108]|uniref:5-formyltetrahydrofolate cyclo-ligase n=1 Tax=Caldicellulosiruptor hydrothermalis (strain DSM 18901 / VKM B-2411 / 108) TaxID=632292 RepID=E4QB90_CALH1|nr:5-formyltetrahydrofolate cyclo-ligase [Caldicellulosiruptor hydrothermalis]ADQ07183.1 5-formyltetrahydrofolate cyclo-ligase [Caldicellulosiruptor hydrothermalis 108]
MVKRKIRKVIGIRRKLVEPRRKLYLDILVYRNLKKLLSTFEFQTIFIYMSLPYEVDTKKIMEYLIKKNKKVYVPRVVNSAEMVACEYKRENKLHRNKLGILEPSSTQQIPPSQIDVCIVPIVAFDKDLNRVGFGKGYYDRFLKDVGPHCIKVGVAYHFQKVKRIKAEEHDVKLDVIVTDRLVLLKKNAYRGEYDEKDTT